MSVKELTAAVIGLGIGREHARALLAAGCKLKHLFDTDAHKAWEFAAEIGHTHETQHLDEIVRDPDVDLVVVASPDNIHYRQVKALLDAGKHVFVEKPLCLSVRELADISAVWRRHGGKVKLMTNHLLRTAPLYKRLKKDIASGRIGTPYAIDGEYLYGRLEKITEGWRGKIPDYSIFLGGGIHMADLMMWIMQERPTLVRGTGNNLCTTDYGFRFHDFAAAEIQFRSGTVGRLVANFGCVQPHQHILRVYGTAGTFLYDDAGARLYESRDPAIPAVRIEEKSKASSRSKLVESFVNAIRDDADMSEDTQNIFDTVSVCLACERAAISGREVEIEYV